MPVSGRKNINFLDKNNNKKICAPVIIQTCCIISSWRFTDYDEDLLNLPLDQSFCWHDAQPG